MKTGELTHVGSRDFRIRPDEGLIDPTSGPSQFGRNRDAYGNWFGVQNAKPMWHYVLDDRYLRRNPHVAPPPSQILLSDVPGQRPVFAVSQPGKFHHASQAGRFTSANSAMIYNDELFGEEFIGNSFVSEPVHNLVHREIVERNGVTFKSHKPKDEENTEFLASEDTWFRPTTIRTGPDGALYIADMYREIIEHPHWVSDDLKPLVDTRSGTDRGRIYRIYPENAKPRSWPRLDKLSTEELVAQLESPSATLRDMVQMQIVGRRVKDAVASLTAIARNSKRAESRLQALCTLDGIDGLSVDLLTHALSDESPGVRGHALRLCGGALKNEMAAIAIRYDSLLDPFLVRDPFEMLQQAYLLGEIDSPRAAGKLADLATHIGDDPFLIAAVLSSLHQENIAAFAKGFEDAGPFDSQFSRDLIAGTIDTALGLKRSDVLAEIAARICAPPFDKERWSPEKLERIAALHVALGRHKLTIDALGDHGTETAKLATCAAEEARRLLLQDDADVSSRRSAIRLIGANPAKSDDDLQLLSQFLTQQSDAEPASGHRGRYLSVQSDDSNGSATG